LLRRKLDIPNFLGPRLQDQGVVEKPQGWRASLALHFLWKKAIAPILLAVLSLTPNEARAGWGEPIFSRLAKL
jgi:hypothetical protein